ncbi:hypothetical protein O181_057624 [Austropuccinia psidii MF-1]|uniref:Reverse transcriptase/retrotransposon-derived protein RNase H-like domain-containing protein n=1 Tax=Austropuccinia psidii MF-1 TaxID=1389203 RepID=A0A9Q3EAW7_9BASI|nr:hypothetical protein [Austropuccinia psidii MF-1]
MTLPLLLTVFLWLANLRHLPFLLLSISLPSGDEVFEETKDVGEDVAISSLHLFQGDMYLPPLSFHAFLEEQSDEEEPEEIETVLKIVPPAYHNYLDVFSKVKSEKLPPHCSCHHHIELYVLLKSVGVMYSLSIDYSETLHAYISENLEKGFIRPSSSSTVEPAIFVKRKDGVLYLCVYYHKLNSVTRKNRYPVPPMNHLLTIFKISTIFSKIDMCDSPFIFNEEALSKSQLLKEAFTTAPILSHFNPSLPTVVETDDSDCAFSAVLIQVNGSGKHAIAFDSHKLLQAELNYEIHDKELLDIAEFLSEFYLTITYGPGRLATLPDSLLHGEDMYPERGVDFIRKNSQNLYQILNQDEIKKSRFFSIKVEMFSDLVDQIQKEVWQDKDYKEVLNNLEGGESVSDYSLEPQAKEFSFKDGVVIPSNQGIQLDFLQKSHDSPLASHPGQEKTLKLIKRDFFLGWNSCNDQGLCVIMSSFFKKKKHST